MARKNVRLPPEFAYLEDFADALTRYAVFQEREPLLAGDPQTAADLLLLSEACGQIEGRNDATKIVAWISKASSWDMRRGGHGLFVLIDLMMELGKRGHPTFLGVYQAVQATDT